IHTQTFFLTAFDIWRWAIYTTHSTICLCFSEDITSEGGSPTLDEVSLLYWMTHARRGGETDNAGLNHDKRVRLGMIHHLQKEKECPREYRRTLSAVISPPKYSSYS